MLWLVIGLGLLVIEGAYSVSTVVSEGQIAKILPQPSAEAKVTTSSPAQGNANRRAFSLVPPLLATKWIKREPRRNFERISRTRWLSSAALVGERKRRSRARVDRTTDGGGGGRNKNNGRIVTARDPRVFSGESLKAAAEYFDATENVWPGTKLGRKERRGRRGHGGRCERPHRHIDEYEYEYADGRTFDPAEYNYYDHPYTEYPSAAWTLRPTKTRKFDDNLYTEDGSDEQTFAPGDYMYHEMLSADSTY